MRKNRIRLATAFYKAKKESQISKSNTIEHRDDNYGFLFKEVPYMSSLEVQELVRKEKELKSCATN